VAGFSDIPAGRAPEYTEYVGEFVADTALVYGMLNTKLDSVLSTQFGGRSMVPDGEVVMEPSALLAVIVNE
jgi:hypothetical protein